MGIIALQTPMINQPASTEVPKVDSNFVAIQALLNGNLDTNNLSPSANIKYSQLLPGTWVPLTLGTGVSAFGSGFTPSARLEGDVVRLKGGITNSGTIATGVTIFVVPGLMHPASSTLMSAVQAGAGSSSGVQIGVQPGGSCVLSSSGPAWTGGNFIGLDGLVYTTS